MASTQPPARSRPATTDASPSHLMTAGSPSSMLHHRAPRSPEGPSSLPSQQQQQPPPFHFQQQQQQQQHYPKHQQHLPQQEQQQHKLERQSHHSHQSHTKERPNRPTRSHPFLHSASPRSLFHSPTQKNSVPSSLASLRRPTSLLPPSIRFSFRSPLASFILGALLSQLLSLPLLFLLLPLPPRLPSYQAPFQPFPTTSFSHKFNMRRWFSSSQQQQQKLYYEQHQHHHQHHQQQQIYPPRHPPHHPPAHLPAPGHPSPDSTSLDSPEENYALSSEGREVAAAQEESTQSSEGRKRAGAREERRNLSIKERERAAAWEESTQPMAGQSAALSRGALGGRRTAQDKGSALPLPSSSLPEKTLPEALPSATVAAGRGGMSPLQASRWSRPAFVLFGDSLTQRSYGDGGWGAALQSLYARKVNPLQEGVMEHKCNELCYVSKSSFETSQSP
ncbi:unnamed protein product [Closterium sp. NIES-54]